jgi:hypothetical protein
VPVNLEVNGAGAFVDALSKFNKDVYKILQDEVRQAASVVANDAKTRIPAQVLYGGMSTGSDRRSPGWGLWTASGERGTAAGTDLNWDRGRVVASIKAGARKARVGRAGVVGINGLVSMQNLAGQKWAKAGKDEPGSRINRSIISRYGDDYPRALKAALFAKGPEASEGIDRAIERAQARWFG